MEGAARDRLRGAGHLAVEPDLLLLPLRVDQGHRGEERLGVGMVRRVEDDARVTHLHQLAQVDHGHHVGQIADDGQVVGDEERADPVLPLKLVEQIEDRGLHRHVEGGDRLVGNEQIGLRRESPRDGYPLLLPPAQLPRQTRGVLAREVDRLQQLPDRSVDTAIAALLRHLITQALQRPAQDLPHAQVGIEGLGRVLEHDLEAAEHIGGPPAQPGRQLPIEEPDAAAGPLCQADDGPGQGRLPAAALPHQSHGPAPPYVEAHPVHRLDPARRLAGDQVAQRPPLGEMHSDVLQVEHVLLGDGQRLHRGALGHRLAGADRALLDRLPAVTARPATVARPRAAGLIERRVLFTDVDSQRAAGPEDAARREIPQRGDLPLNGAQAHLGLVLAEARHAVQ